MINRRKLITAERIVKSGFINFGRNIWLSVAAIAMMLITLTILLFAVIANATFNHTITDITSHIDISIFLKDSVTDQQRQNIIRQLKNVDNVKSVSYRNKLQALKEYQAQQADNPQLLAAISETDNPLPASIIIKPVDPNILQPIIDFTQKPNIKVYETDTNNKTTQFRQDAVKNITRATHFFQQAGVAGIAVFILISVLIIFNTIRMAIFNRRDELIIMRLLGASTAFIRGPFVVETMLYGLVAALISILAVAGLFAVASQTLQASSFGLLDINYANRYFTNHLWQILTIQILAGILIGAASSMIATRRYLKHNR
jgi:cell division transport system permease protein